MARTRRRHRVSAVLPASTTHHARCCRWCGTPAVYRFEAHEGHGRQDAQAEARGGRRRLHDQKEDGIAQPGAVQQLQNAARAQEDRERAQALLLRQEGQWAIQRRSAPFAWRPSRGDRRGDTSGSALHPCCRMRRCPTHAVCGSFPPGSVAATGWVGPEARDGESAVGRWSVDAISVRTLCRGRWRCRPWRSRTRGVRAR